MSLLQRIKKLELLRRYEDGNFIVLTTHGTIIKGDKVLSFRQNPEEKYQCNMEKRITPEWVKVSNKRDDDVKDYNEEQEFKQILFHYKGQWDSKEALNQWIDDNFASFPPEDTYNENDTVIDFHIKIAWPREDNSL